MHTSDALSRLHNFTDTPDQKDIIPLNFLQHFTPHYIIIIINLFIIYIHVRNSCSLFTYTVIYINIYTIGYC